MNDISFANYCDFHCWVIKYDVVSAFEKRYLQGSLKNSSSLVPLLWHHNHNDPDMVIGCATLEHRDDGVYAYCNLFNKPNLENTKLLLSNKGCVSLSPFVTNITYNGNTVVNGLIREVSLIFDRIDRDDAYFPIIVERSVLDD